MELEENAVVADRFRLVRMIGRGGMGSVWHAFDTLKFIEASSLSAPVDSATAAKVDPSPPASATIAKPEPTAPAAPAASVAAPTTTRAGAATAALPVKTPQPPPTSPTPAKSAVAAPTASAKKKWDPGF